MRIRERIHRHLHKPDVGPQNCLHIDEIRICKSDYVWIRGWIASENSLNVQNLYKEDFQVSYLPRPDVKNTFPDLNMAGYLLRKRITSDYIRIDNIGGNFKLEQDISHVRNQNANSKSKKKNASKLDKKYDIAIINGPNLDESHQITRWRVLHRAEEIRSCGKTCKIFGLDKIDDICINNYNEFIIYRANLTPDLEDFIYKVKSANKTATFDLDDLDLDVSSIENIPSLIKLGKDTMMSLLNDCIWLRATLESCGLGTAPTKKLVDEMLKYVEKADIVRNKASVELRQISDFAYKNYMPSNKQHITIGYFSGNIQHNDDIAIVEQALINILDANNNVRILIVGIIDIPELLKQHSDKVIFVPYQPWRELPDIMMECDIAIAPICETEFNEAKSEIKWIEAALLRIPLIATDFGAFKEIIVNNETGILCKNTTAVWERSISILLNSPDLRNKIGQRACEACCSSSITSSNN